MRHVIWINMYLVKCFVYLLTISLPYSRYYNKTHRWAFLQKWINITSLRVLLRWIYEAVFFGEWFVVKIALLTKSDSKTYTSFYFCKVCFMITTLLNCELFFQIWKGINMIYVKRRARKTLHLLQTCTFF